MPVAEPIPVATGWFPPKGLAVKSRSGDCDSGGENHLGRRSKGLSLQSTSSGDDGEHTTRRSKLRKTFSLRPRKSKAGFLKSRRSPSNPPKCASDSQIPQHSNMSQPKITRRARVFQTVLNLAKRRFSMVENDQVLRSRTAGPTPTKPPSEQPHLHAQRQSSASLPEWSNSSAKTGDKTANNASAQPDRTEGSSGSPVPAITRNGSHAFQRRLATKIIFRRRFSECNCETLGVPTNPDVGTDSLPTRPLSCSDESSDTVFDPEQRPRSACTARVVERPVSPRRRSISTMMMKKRKSRDGDDAVQSPSELYLEMCKEFEHLLAPVRGSSSPQSSVSNSRVPDRSKPRKPAKPRRSSHIGGGLEVSSSAEGLSSPRRSLDLPGSPRPASQPSSPNMDGRPAKPKRSFFAADGKRSPSGFSLPCPSLESLSKPSYYEVSGTDDYTSASSASHGALPAFGSSDSESVINSDQLRQGAASISPTSYTLSNASLNNIFPVLDSCPSLGSSDQNSKVLVVTVDNDTTSEQVLPEATSEGHPPSPVLLVDNNLSADPPAPSKVESSCSEAAADLPDSVTGNKQFLTLSQEDSVDSMDSSNIKWKDDSDFPGNHDVSQNTAGVGADNFLEKGETPDKGSGIIGQETLMKRWSVRRSKLHRTSVTSRIIESYEKRETALATGPGRLK